jgi:uracil-DNA glycosylase
MEINIEPSWKQVLKEEFDKPYFKNLMDFVTTEYNENQCFPPREQIFEAFKHAPFSRVKVVIIGQDPYHGYGQSHGLCFSVQDSVAVPPSLRNIFKEINEDIGTEIPSSGNLTRWANQGVLLLNATMTVREKQAGSHQNKGWEKFTDAVINKLSQEREGLVFMLWGGPAKKKGANIDASKHLILESGHPSPLAANRGYWFGNKHFSLANIYLKKLSIQPIDW